MTYPVPRLPVFDWNVFSGAKVADTPCLLAHPQARFTSSGRASILLALEMLAVGPDDKVLVPTYHCPTMIAPIVARDAQPIFYPINHNGAPDLDWIQRQDVRNVRAILVAHFFGLPQPLAEIRQWCDQQGIRLIEDCAHALFGRSDNRAIGSWGDLAIASLTKFLPVPEGGCLINSMTSLLIPNLDHPKPVSQVKAAFDIFHTSANHGRLKILGNLIRGFHWLFGKFRRKPPVRRLEATSPTDGFTIDVVQSHRALTYPCRWVALNASRERIVARRRAHYVFFAREFSGLNGLRPLRAALPEDCAPYVFPLWVDSPDPGYAELRRLEFPVSRWDRLWPKVPTMHNDSGIEWSHHILQLACHQDLQPDELRAMADTVKRLYTSGAVSATPTHETT
jgi:perosamine synthetase